MANKSTGNSRKSNPSTAAAQVTDVILVLDKSGSMQSCRKAAIDGFNEQVDSIRKNASQPGVGDVYVTLIVFDDTSNIVFERTSLDKLHKLTERDYVPGGSTAWLNAVDRGIETMRKLADYDAPTHAYLMQSITDGEENHSHLLPPHATWESIAKKVDECQKTGRWTFSVIGANIDLSVVAQRMGVPVANTISYAATDIGTRAATSTARRASTNYFDQRAQGMSASASYMDDVTGGARHVDDIDPNVSVQPPYHPTNPPQPAAPPPSPRAPQNRSRSGHEGEMHGGTVSGAKSPLLGQTDKTD